MMKGPIFLPQFSAFFKLVLTTGATGTWQNNRQLIFFSCCQILQLLLGSLKINLYTDLFSKPFSTKATTVHYVFSKLCPKDSLTYPGNYVAILTKNEGKIILDT